jgi:hypothetical protein
MTRLLPALLLLLIGVAHAASPVEQAQMAELERARAHAAGQVQLSAYDLVDELVYGWTERPPFGQPTPVVLASVTVPVGLGTGLQALLENHLSATLTANPSAGIQLSHCPQCTSVVVRSGPEATVLARGIDQPEVLAELGAETGRHALFIDIEAEGAFLVLRARITRLTPDLPIVWSHTLASDTSAAALLRQPHALKSAAEARAEYLAALQDRGPLAVPVRVTVRAYARRPDSGLGAPPFLWLQSGVELGTDSAQAWTGSLLAGYSLVPQAHQGLMGQARVQRLLTGRARSTLRPDLYAFFGGAVMTVWGPSTAVFRPRALGADELLTDTAAEDPRTSFGTLHFGLDLRVGNRMGLSSFLETIPSLNSSANLGQYISLVGMRFHCLGTEVAFWF